MAPEASSREPHSDDPLYLSVVDLFARVAFVYFIVVGAALVVDVVRGDQFVFRSWSSFALQSGLAFLLAAIVTRQALTKRQQGSRRFVPANIVSSAVIVGAVLAAGTLAGGFFPDAVAYQRRAPEPFFRTVSALVPLAIAIYLVLRSSERERPVIATPVQEPPLTGGARDAALRALEMLDRAERELTAFHQRVASGAQISRADADRLWERMDGKSLVVQLRQLPPEHAITNAMREAAVAQTDAVYLVALAHRGHEAVGHTAESARAFIAEVAARRTRPGADAATLGDLARGEATRHRDIAAGLLQASRFTTPTKVT